MKSDAEKLMKLYAPSIKIADELVDSTVKRTQGVSAAFLKELMRRSTQYAIERNEAQDLSEADIESALDEMLHRGGMLSRKLLGAGETPTRVLAMWNDSSGGNGP